MRRVEGTFRPHAKGPGLKPGSTDKFHTELRSVEEVSSACESPVTHVFPRFLVTGPLPLDRLTLLFMLQALLTACGGGGGGGGDGPVTAAPPLPQPASPPPPEPDPTLPIEETKSASSSSEMEVNYNSLKRRQNEPSQATQTVKIASFKEDLGPDQPPPQEPPPWFFPMLPENPEPETDYQVFFLMAVAHPLDLVQISMTEKGGANTGGAGQQDDDNDLVTLQPVQHEDPNIRVAVIRFQGNTFDFESERVRDADGSPHFLVRVVATKTKGEIAPKPIGGLPQLEPSQQITETIELTLKLLIANRPDEPIMVDALPGLSVAENSTDLKGSGQNGPAMGMAQLSATTGESEPEIEYRIAGGAAHDYVAVSRSGVISLKQAPDHEAIQNLTIRVEARHVVAGQDDDAGWQGAREITITIEDRDDAPTAISLNNALPSLAETADVSSRTKVADLDVSDVDSLLAFLRHSFTLSGAHSELFEVVGKALYLKANTPLDHETASQLDVTVSLDGTAFTANYQLAIDDRNDMPLLLAATAQVEVDEGRLDTGYVVRATKQDDAGDPVRYAITGGAGSNRFTVDQATGALRFNPEKKVPNHERPRDSDRDNIYEVEVTATSASVVPGDSLVQSATQTIRVTVRDVNDVRPVVTSGIAASVNENIASNDDAGQRGEAVVVYRATATKDGVGPPLRWLLGGDDADLFGINDDGEVWFRQSPDYDGDWHGGRTGYSFSVTAMSGALRSEAHNVRVTVVNRADERPVLTPPGRLTVDETETGKTSTDFKDVVVARLAATTREVGPEPVQFTLLNFNSPYFQLSDDGVVTLRQGIDYEALTEQQKRDGLPLVVSAYQRRQGEGVMFGGAQVLNVHVNDRLDPIVPLAIVHDPVNHTLTASAPAVEELELLINDIWQARRVSDGSGGYVTNYNGVYSWSMETEFGRYWTLVGDQDNQTRPEDWLYVLPFRPKPDRASSAYVALPEGGSVTETLTVTIRQITESGHVDLISETLHFTHTGRNDAPVARHKTHQFVPSLTKTHVFDETFFDFTEFDIDQSTGRPEAWSRIRIANFANADSVFWTGDPTTLGLTGLSGLGSYSLKTLYQHGARHLDIAPSELGNLAFRWSQTMINKIIAGETAEVRLSYQMFDKHDVGSGWADLYFDPHMAASGNVQYLGPVMHKQVYSGFGTGRHNIDAFVDGVYEEKTQVEGVDNSGFFRPTHVRFVFIGNNLPFNGIQHHPDYDLLRPNSLFNPFGDHADPVHSRVGAHVATNDFAFRSIGENQYRDYATAKRKAGGVENYFDDGSYVIGFHLSIDGGESWSRLLYYYSDANRYLTSLSFREFTGIIPDWQAHSHPRFSFIYIDHEFFDHYVGMAGENVADTPVNHIWGFGQSENLWFGGSRKLSFGNLQNHVRADGTKQGKVWYELREVGGLPGKNDTVLLNHVDGETGHGPNLYAVLYDYTIQKDDVADDILLLPLGTDVL